jgi:hypothetical protein
MLEVRLAHEATYLVWKIFPHPLTGSRRRLISGFSSTPLAMGFTVRLCSAEAKGWVLLFQWGLSFKFLGDFLLINLRSSVRGMLVVG